MSVCACVGSSYAHVANAGDTQARSARECEGERERAGERGRERVGRRDVTLMDEPFSVFSPIRKGGKSEGGREGAGGIHFHFHARSAPFLSQDIKTDFLGGGAALLLPRPRPAVVRWSGPSGGPRKGRTGVAKKLNTEGRARARSRSSGCSLPSAFNLSSHAFRWWPLSLSLCHACGCVSCPVQLHGGRRCRICGWPKADPSSVRPQIFDANETSSFEIRQRSLSARARASEVGRGLGGRGSRVARNCTFARPPGGRGRASVVSGRKLCDLDKF